MVISGLVGIVAGIIIQLTLLRLREAAFTTRESEQGLVLRIFGLAIPKGICDHIFEVALGNDRSALTKEVTVVYSHKYSGSHEIGIVCERSIGFGLEVLILIGVKITWRYEDGRILYEVDKMVILRNLWLDGPGRNGFTLVCYEVPDDLPIKERLVCEIRLSDLGAAEKAYGSLRVYSQNALIK